MKTLLSCIILSIAFSCGKQDPSIQKDKLGGYWGIESVTSPYGKKIDFSINAVVDFIEVSEEKGIRTKVAPQFDGSFMNNGTAEKFNLKIEEDKFFVKTPGENAFPSGFHPPSQFIDYLPEHAKKNVKLVFKPNNPWRAKTPKGVKMLQLPMSYHFNPDFYVLPGVLDTYITHQFNPQIIFNKKGEFLIKRGTPLAMYIPIRTEEFDLVVREQTKEDTDAFGKQNYATGSVFNSKLQKYEKLLKDRSGEKP